MAFDVWFPLAIYYHDLEESEIQNPEILNRINELRTGSGEKRTEGHASWTGDVHRVDRLHFDDRMEWLTQNVARHAEAYLRLLGHDLDKCAVHIQRSWPVIAVKGQRVARHAHHTAHISAVYYVSSPTSGKGGRIEFFNDNPPNEIQRGIGSTMTGGYTERNSLNYGSAAYEPKPGRLLLFPSKTTHAVEPNETDEQRISISFDLIVTSRGGDHDGGYEFLMPAPSGWRQIIGGTAALPDAQHRTPAPLLGPGMIPLDRLLDLDPVTDRFALPDLDDHPLWTPRSFSHCSSRGGWAAYRAELDGLAPEDWLSDEAHTPRIYPQVGHWKATQDALAWLLSDLRARSVPLAGAAVSGPQLQVRDGSNPEDAARLTSHLGIYLRVDHDATPAAIEFADGARIDLPPGTMALIPGARRHHLTGASHVVHFRVDLPAVARTGQLGGETLQDPALPDLTVAAALAALPLNAPMPALAAVDAKLSAARRRQQRKARAEAAPAVRKFLRDGADPASASPADLQEILAMGNAGNPQPPGSLLLEDVPMLSPAQCAILRDFADTHITSVIQDTVDDLPEYQLNLNAEAIEGLLGRETAETLFRMPERMGAPKVADPLDAYREVYMFLRIYAPDKRAFIPFHHDTSDYTVNVALSDDAAFSGGRLLVLQGDGLRAIERTEGRAVLHAGNVVHGVSRIAEGTRYSLILFFEGQKLAAPPPQADQPVGA